MTKNENTIRILMAEDDADDRLLFEEALEETRFANQVDFVEDGQELMDYLHREGKYISLQNDPLPGILLLDLNMPKKDGRQCLAEIKQDPGLRHIPVVVLTTSSSDEDVIKTYDLGVNSFITKPVTFDSMLDAVRKVTDYWFELVRIPRHNPRKR